MNIVAEKSRWLRYPLHEVEYSAGIACREPTEISPGGPHLKHGPAKVAQKAKPNFLSLITASTMNIQDNHINLEAEMRRRDDAILDEIRAAGYEGMTVNGRDLEVF